MATFLLYRDKKANLGGFRNSSGVHAVLVTAANETEARETAIANRRTGETKIYDEWAAVQLSTENLPAGFSPTYFEGDALVPGTLARG